MSWVAAAIVGGAVLGPVVGSMVSGNAAQNAANTQAQAGAAAQSQLLDIGKQVSGLYQPYQTTGQAGLTALEGNIPYFNTQAQTYQPVTTAQIMAQLPANYEFMKQQGLGATSQNINVGGGGSNANMARTKFAEDYASNAYQNALNNYMAQQAQGFNQTQAQKTNIYNTLSGIAGIGQNAVQGTANAQLGIGTNISNITQGIGNAQAAGQIGTANAISSGIGSIGNAATMYGLSQYGAQNAAQSALSAGGYGSNAYSNFMSNPSTNPSSSSFVGPIITPA